MFKDSYPVKQKARSNICFCLKLIDSSTTLNNDQGQRLFQPSKARNNAEHEPIQPSYYKMHAQNMLKCCHKRSSCLGFARSTTKACKGVQRLLSKGLTCIALDGYSLLTEG